MLNAIKELFDKSIRPARQGAADDDHRLRLATAALLIETMYMDYEINDEERQAVLRAVRSKFGLTAEEGDALIQLAKGEARQAVDYHQFTSLINKGYSPEQKEKVIEYLWQVAYADGHLDKYEEHWVRKIADLLYVPHSAFIQAKHRALRDAENTGS